MATAIVTIGADGWTRLYVEAGGKTVFGPKVIATRAGELPSEVAKATLAEAGYAQVDGSTWVQTFGGTTGAVFEMEVTR